MSETLPGEAVFKRAPFRAETSTLCMRSIFHPRPVLRVLTVVGAFLARSCHACMQKHSPNRPRFAPPGTASPLAGLYRQQRRP